jgi:hypothetical protein
MAALPVTDEDAAAGLDAAALQQLFARLERRRTPTSALHRFGVLAGLQAQVALAYVAWWLRGLFHDAAENQRRLLETHLRVAIKLLEGMGYLRGAVMKVGQTLANCPRPSPTRSPTPWRPFTSSVGKILPQARSASASNAGALPSSIPPPSCSRPAA